MVEHFTTRLSIPSHIETEHVSGERSIGQFYNFLPV